MNIKKKLPKRRERKGMKKTRFKRTKELKSLSQVKTKELNYILNIYGDV